MNTPQQPSVTSQANQRVITRVTLTSLITNLAISFFKILLGIAGHSQALLADGFHSFSDGFTDVAILLGARYWHAPPDKHHPYGHWRLEAMITALIGFSLIGVASGILWHAVLLISAAPEPQIPSPIALIAAFSSILVKEGLYRWTINKGRKLRSQALIANAWHHRSDAMSSLPAMLAILVAILFPQWHYVDITGAIIVAGFIVYTALKIIWHALGELLDESASDQLHSAVRSNVKQIEGVSDLHAIRTRKTGPGYHLDLHVLVPGEMTVTDSHAIAEAVKQRLINIDLDIIDVVVHIEPDDVAKPREP